MGKKAPALRELGPESALVEIDERLKPASDEFIIHKKHASSFFQTNLVSLLIANRVDTVIVTGCTTSGCVRAAVVDASAYGFHVVVPAEAVSDRAPGPHSASLFDIDCKYADVVSTSEACDYIAEGP